MDAKSPSDIDRVRDGLNAAMKGVWRGSDAADRLCAACVELLDIDGVALSVSFDQGASTSAFGSSGTLARELHELQFTFGEGPCGDALRDEKVVLVNDLREPEAARWPAFAGAALERGVHLVLAVPVSVVHRALGVLDMYRDRPGALDATTLLGAHIAAELATAPLLDVMGADEDASETKNPDGTGELTALARIEVYQASGMLMSQLQIGVADAVVRLRGYAFAHDMTATAVAWEIIEHRLFLHDDRPEHTSEVDGETR